ncbi:hypothetical protein [Bifidobacterium callitrichos]|uniref:hypothetical protein n=1 Tax=Bifidobacterium callitrichos TaxID=762209 RepID=UPI0011B1E430|nr:hypothetical protein [Bifidobacterium callitrichos]
MPVDDLCLPVFRFSVGSAPPDTKTGQNGRRTDRRNGLKSLEFRRFGNEKALSLWVGKGDGGGYEIHNFKPKNWLYPNENRRTDQLPYRSNYRSLLRVANWMS